MDSNTEQYRFSDFALDLKRNELRRFDDLLPLSDKEVSVVKVLIEQQPDALSHNEIIEAVWNGTSVENSSVEKAIANIRKVLDDNPRNPTFIKTIYGEGYRFIADVRVEDRMALPENALESDSIEVGWRRIPLNRRYAVLLGCLIIVLAFGGFAYFKGGEVWFRMNAKVIFADDFSSERLDKSKWKLLSGKTLKIEDGILKMKVEDADNFPKLTSSYFSFDPNKAMTIKSRIKVQYMQFSKEKTYFGGNFQFIPKTPDSDTHQGMKPLLWGVSYNNYDFEGKVTYEHTGKTVEHLKVEGFYLVRDGGRASTLQHYWDGKVGPRIEPIWGEWFDQKIIYKPWNGDIEYFINDEKKTEYNVGKLREDRIGNQLRFWINPSGWYLHHSMEIDYIEVTQ